MVQPLAQTVADLYQQKEHPVGTTRDWMEQLNHNQLYIQCISLVPRLLCMGEEKSLVHTVCACSVFSGFLGIWKFPWNMLRYTKLWEAYQLFPYKRCLPLTTLCVNNDEGATKVLSSSLVFNCPCIRPFQLNTVAREWRNLSLWSSPIASNEAMQTVTGKAILFVTSKPPICVPQRVILCSAAFQQVKRNWP